MLTHGQNLQLSVVVLTGKKTLGRRRFYPKKPAGDSYDGEADGSGGFYFYSEITAEGRETGMPRSRKPSRRSRNVVTRTGGGGVTRTPSGDVAVK